MPADKSLSVFPTPGPWALDTRDGGAKVRTKSGELIAICESISHSDARNRANAKLVACAPLFLDVLNYMLSYQIDESYDTLWNVRQLQLLAQRAIAAAPPKQG